MNRENFFAELKRRNVYKVAIAYAIVGWLVMQVAATVVPALHLSDAITSAVVLLVLLGFPIALVLAWAFEITPEGIKRAEDVSPNESITHQTGRKLVRTTIALAVIAAGLLAFQFLRPKIAKPAAATTLAAPIASIARSDVDLGNVCDAAMTKPQAWIPHVHQWVELPGLDSSLKHTERDPG